MIDSSTLRKLSLLLVACSFLVPALAAVQLEKTLALQEETELEASLEWGPWFQLGAFDHPWEQAKDPEQHLAKGMKRLRADGPGPDFNRTWTAAQKQPVSWNKLELADEFALDVGQIDFNAQLQASESSSYLASNSVVYIYRKLVCTAETKLTLRIGSDDGLVVWWDAKPLVFNNVARGLNINSDRLEVTVTPGTHHLLAAISQKGGTWGFRMAGRSDFDQDAVNQAVDKGINYLLSHQYVDGSWGYHSDYQGGSEAFTGYTLRKCGLPANHPAILRARNHAQVLDGEFTYTVCSNLLLECSMGGKADTKLVKAWVNDLVDWQESSGGYSYPLHPDGNQRQSDDLSNTLYVALALKAAAQAGVKAPKKTWNRLIDNALRYQEPKHEVTLSDGSRATAAGFIYWSGAGATGSMTEAGIGILRIASEELGLKPKLRLSKRIEEACAWGVNWLDANWTFSKNPGGSHHYFHIYGIERVGSLLGEPTIGGRDWYQEGAAYLLEAQLAEGNWPGAHVDTLLALLFLNRATAPFSGKRKLRRDLYETTEPGAKLLLRAQGDTPMTAYLQGTSKEVRNDFRWGSDAPGELRIYRVVYQGRKLGETGDWLDLFVQDLDAAQPTNHEERFPARIVWPTNGEWQLRVAVHLYPSNFGAAGDEIFRANADNESLELISEPLTVHIDEVLHPEWLEYARHPAQNLLRNRLLEGESSTRQSDALGPQNAFDGNVATRWMSAASDAQPWLRLKLAKGVKVNTIAVSQAFPRRSDEAQPRVSSIRLRINRQKGGAEYALNLDPNFKTMIELPKLTRIEQLDIELLDAEGRTTQGLGLSEVELLRRD